jgi:dolichyl-phosphate-mannose-protein mannosyltransferase
MDVRADRLLALVAGAALIAGFTALRGIDPFDEGVVLQAARRVADGQTPYRDFLWSYGPAQPYLLGASFELLGTSLLGWRVLRVATVALTALLVFLLARRLAGPRLAILAWLVAACALAQPANASPFLVALMLGLLALLVASGGHRGRGRALLAGVLVAFAAAWRLDFALYGAAAVGAALVVPPGRLRSRLGNVAAMALAAATVTALVYLPFALAAGPADVYDDLVGKSLREREYWTLPFPLDYDGRLRAWPPGALAEDAKDVLGFYLPLVAMVGLAVAALDAALRLRAERRLAPETAGLLVFALGAVAYLLSRTDEFHATPLVVALACLLAASLARRSSGRVRAMLAPAAAVMLALLLAYGASNRLSALFLPKPSAAIDVPVADGVRAPPAEARAIEQVVREVKRRVPAGEPIYVAPARSDLVAFENALLYVMTERDNPTGEDVGLRAAPREQERLVRALERSRPRVVVRWTDPLSSKREPNPRGRSSGSRILDRYLDRRYRLLERLHHYDLLVRR